MACTICANHLPLGPRPIVRLSPEARVVIIGQAPGKRVYETGIPWDDASGKRLREWMGIEPDIFKDTSKIGILPMGFCYPGRGPYGDLPPRKECAPAWHTSILDSLVDIRLTLLIGSYAQNYYLPFSGYKTFTNRVAHFSKLISAYFPLPHPSPRNNIWKKRIHGLKQMSCRP